MDSIIERDFMGLSRRNGNETEAERMSTNEQPHGEREKIVSLNLFQEADKSTEPQLSSGSFCGLSEAIAKAANANGSVKVSMPNTNMQWTYWTKAAALQQFMSFKNYQDERPEKRKFNQLVASGFQPVATVDTFKSNHRSTSASQKSYSFSPISKDNAEFRNSYSGANCVPHQHFDVPPSSFSVKAFDDQSFTNPSSEQAGAFLREKASHSPTNFREHFSSPTSFKGQDPTVALGGKLISSIPFTRQPSVLCGAAASSIGTTPMRADSNLPGKLANAQLTIFYAGTVNVYDNIPPDKAQAIMLAAENGSSMPTKMTDLSPQNFVMSTAVPTNSNSRPATPNICSSRPNALASMTPQGPPQKPLIPIPQVHSQKTQLCSKPGQCIGVSSSNGELESNQNNGAGSNQQECAKKIVPASTPNAGVPRVPLARKASLARFLEKRNGRAPANLSCPTEKSSPHSSLQQEKSFSSMSSFDSSLQQEKSFSSMSSFDGCLSPQHDLNSDALHMKKMSRSDSMEHSNYLSLRQDRA